MNSTKFRMSIRMLKENLKFIPIISLLIYSFLGACSPTEVTALPLEVQNTKVEIPASPTIESTQPPASTPEEETIYPYYLPLATKPDIEPQTINNVTTTIDWAYVDESRVALHYTISGLDWPAGTGWDPTLVQITSPAISDIAYAAGGWNTMPIDHGVITSSIDQLLVDDALDAAEHPTVDLSVDIPVEGPSSVGTFHFDFTVPVMDGIKMENLDQTVVANDVSMTLKTLVLNPSRVEALVCFQMPSAVDWGLTASTITVGGKEYPFTGGGLLAGTDGKNFRLTDPERCTTVGFDIAYDPPATSVTLTVPKLVASIPEVIDKERVAAANQRLAGTGIEFDYANLDHGGNIVVLGRPQGATDEEIYPLIWDALADQYDGPWIFNVTIER